MGYGLTQSLGKMGFLLLPGFIKLMDYFQWNSIGICGLLGLLVMKFVKRMPETYGVLENKQIDLIIGLELGTKWEYL
jgi:hypothetical protein